MIPLIFYIYICLSSLINCELRQLGELAGGVVYRACTLILFTYMIAEREVRQVIESQCRFCIIFIYIRLITRVSVRYGEIFHEPKVSEISRHISQLTSVISALFL